MPTPHSRNGEVATAVKPRAIDPQLITHMTRNEADMAFKKRVQTVFDWVEPTDDKLVLDMPCGRGFYLNMIRYVSECRLVGAELDWDVILKAQRNVGHLPDVALNNANIYALPYKDETFDAAILSEILEHVDDDVAALKEVYRVLKPVVWWRSRFPTPITPFCGTRLTRRWNRCSISIFNMGCSPESGRIMCACTSEMI